MNRCENNQKISIAQRHHFLNLSSADVFDLDKSKTLSSGKRLETGHVSEEVKRARCELELISELSLTRKVTDNIRPFAHFVP